jgi:predicted GIY-YIG superfamily endonuclease
LKKSSLATFYRPLENLSMASGQLWLFPPPKPLLERLGEEFFRTLPSGPGVYYMCEEGEGVLYVGKARNLRKRLSSYRVANPERFPRRMIRLLHRVTRIEWDECRTEAIARHREEELICVLAPRFNAAGKSWPSSKRKAPNFKFQAPEKLQAPTSKFGV